MWTVGRLHSGETPPPALRGWGLSPGNALCPGFLQASGMKPCGGGRVDLRGAQCPCSIWAGVPCGALRGGWAPRRTVGGRFTPGPPGVRAPLVTQGPCEPPGGCGPCAASAGGQEHHLGLWTAVGLGGTSIGPPAVAGPAGLSVAKTFAHFPTDTGALLPSCCWPTALSAPSKATVLDVWPPSYPCDRTPIGHSCRPLLCRRFSWGPDSSLGGCGPGG